MRKQHRYRPAGCHRLEDRLAAFDPRRADPTPALIGTLSTQARRRRAEGRASRPRLPRRTSVSRRTIFRPRVPTCPPGLRLRRHVQGLHHPTGETPASPRTSCAEHGTTAGAPSTGFIVRTVRSQTNSTYVLQAFHQHQDHRPRRRLPAPRPSHQPANVVPPPTATSASATIYTLTATDAIQSSLVTTINAIKFISLGTYNKH